MAENTDTTTTAANMTDAEKAKYVRERPFKRTLPVKMTDAERLEYADKVGLLSSQIAEKEAARKTAADKAKAEIDDLEAELRSAERTLHCKELPKDVECVEVLDYRAKEVTSKRTDTGEVLSQRTMSPHEVQMVLGADADGEASDADEAKADEKPARKKRGGPAGQATEN